MRTNQKLITQIKKLTINAQTLLTSTHIHEQVRGRYLSEGEEVGGREHHHCVVHGVILLLLQLERIYKHRLRG